MSVPQVIFQVRGVTSTATTWTLHVARATYSATPPYYVAEDEVGTIPLSSLADATSFGALIGEFIAADGQRVDA